MNKRQWKKKYKKQHGCNPPTAKQVNSWMHTIPGSISALVKGFEKAFTEIRKSIDSAIEQIKTMPEEEFEEKLHELTPEQREMAMKIRYGRKGGDENVG